MKQEIVIFSLDGQHVIASDAVMLSSEFDPHRSKRRGYFPCC